MHEVGIITSVLDTVVVSAKDAGALRVLKIDLSIGEMTEAIEDCLVFAFEALQETQEYLLCKDAKLCINMVKPKSVCLECGYEYEHDRFHMLCPKCQSITTKLVSGREMQIDSIEVDLPD